MKKNDLIICSVLFFIAIISRAPFIEQFHSHWDGPQFAIAILHYSLEQHTPAPPGYPLYIALGKLLNLFIHDPHKALLLISILESAIGAIIFYLVGKNVYKRFVGIIAALLFLTGSTFYYFSLTAYGYGLVPLTTTLLAFVVYQIFFKQKPLGFLLGLVFGLCFGIRPQELPGIIGLFILGLVLLSKKEKLKAITAFIFTTLLWLVPLVHSSGNVQNYLEINSKAGTAAFSPVPIQQHIELMIKGFLLSFGIASGFLFYYLWKIKTKKLKIVKKYKNAILFYSAWIIPGFLFNLFIRTDHAGYQMSYLAGFLLLIAYAIWQVTKKNKLLFITTMLLIAIFNLYWFFYDRDPQFVKPYRITSFHYSDIRKNDLKVGSKVDYVKQHFAPKETLIISTEVLWRPYSYYLKDYSYIVLFALDSTDVPYSYNRIDSINWKIKWYQNKQFIVSIPPHIKKVVFMDDPAPQWILNYPYKIFKLPGNSTITSISVKPGDKLKYNYHKIKIKN